MCACSPHAAGERARQRKIAEDRAMHGFAYLPIRARIEFGETWSRVSSQCSGSALGLDAGDQFLRLRKEARDDDVDACRRGMDAVPLVQGAVPNDTV